MISEALKAGGDFAELYAEKRRTTSLSFEDGRLEKSSSGSVAGASVRVIRGRNTAFVSTDRFDEEALINAARLAGEGAGDGGAEPQNLVTSTGSSVHNIEMPVGSVATADKAALLAEADRAARSSGREVAQVTAGYSDTLSEVMVANSEGCLATEERTRVRLVVHVVAIRDGVMQTGYESIGAHKGMELFRDTGPASVGEKAAAKAIRMLDSRPAPGGKMTVVLHRGFGGVLFHEACGHGLEADAVEKGASVFAGKSGEKVASELVTLVDDGSIANAWGSNAFDDEGTPTGRNVLVEEGRLAGFLYDYLRARNAGVKPTGNGRRQSYRYPPIPRMTNTFILAGASTPEEVIESTEKGFYAKTLSGGQVEPASGDFVFGVSEGYLIEDGRVTSPLRGATLIGNGFHALKNIDMVADDFEFNIGVCGKDGQGVPVGSGQPTLRIGDMTIGGTEV
mgnify:CR=1 FL=1